MVGMDHVANEVDGLIAEAIVSRQRMEQGLPVNQATNHLIFAGGPGTGKTTVARDVASIYHALGLLPTDKFVEASRADLVGQYTGETAIKTRNLLKQAKGGVLFIDEAYALKHGEQDLYGQEAIDELLTEAENKRGETVIILAGYPQEMEGFLNTNPGLRRRFPNRLHFPNYDFPSLKKIMSGMLKSGQYKVPDRAAKAALDMGIQRVASNPQSGNAGDVRNLYERVAREQARRLASEPHADRQLQVITESDVMRALSHQPDVEERPRRKKGALVKA